MRPIRSPGAILCFHGITSPAIPGQSLVHVSAAAFRTLVEAAGRMGQLVPLRDLVRLHTVGRSTAGLIALTADDAYASLLGDTAAFIAREAIPLTVFVVTQAAGAGARFWWDRVDDLFAQVAPQRWREFEDACGLPDDYRRGQTSSDGPLRPFRQWMLAAHRGRWPDQLEAELQQLEREVGTESAQRSMTFEQLATFAAIPSVDVGVHTRTHPVLPLLSDGDLGLEIATAFECLRQRFANTVPVLALPFGLFDERTLLAARGAGMAASLTLAGRTLKRHGGRDDLPRFCLCRQDRPLKLRARLTGVFDRGINQPSYPALPSATT